jgi:hypothetical protein
MPDPDKRDQWAIQASVPRAAAGDGPRDLVNTPDLRTRRRFAVPLLLSLATGVIVTVTAYICAWRELGRAFRYRYYLDEEHPTELPSLWEFATVLDGGGVRDTCVLAGAFAFAACLIASADWKRKRSLAGILVVNVLTAVFAILTAFVISALHVPSGH